jgi:N-acetylmuramoyl-L-alanine amidase
VKKLLAAVLLCAAVLPASAQSLKDFAAKTGSRLFWEPYRNVLLIAGTAHSLSVDLATGHARGDGQISFDLTVDPKTGTVSRDDWNTLMAWWGGQPVPSATPSPVPSPLPRATGGSGPRIQVIVLDPGHGGTDPGSIGRHTIDGKAVVLQEKDLTLAVVLELQKLLTQAYPDRTIVLTRSSDTYPTLEARVQTAHAQKLGDEDSIVFLSVHFNASLNRKAKGIELWYVPQDYERDVIAGGDIPESVFPVLNTLVDSEYKKESRQLAEALAKGLGDELGGTVQRGLKENPWFVVRMARMPAVLAELGFITNPDEAALFLDPEYLKKLARGLYTGLASFIADYEDRR